MIYIRIFYSVLCVFYLWMHSLSALSQDTFDEVLQRLTIKQAIEISYTQTKRLKLLQSPWQGSGMLYISPQQMIIAQQSPKELFILITDSTLQYLDTQQNIYYLKKLKGSFKVPQMAVFVDLIYGKHTVNSLREIYMTRFSSDTSGWNIRLTDEKDNQLEAVEISGQNGLPANSLDIWLKDGDKTSWLFSPAISDVNITEKMQLIVKKMYDYSAADRSGSSDR